MNETRRKTLHIRVRYRILADWVAGMVLLIATYGAMRLCLPWLSGEQQFALWVLCCCWAAVFQGLVLHGRGVSR